MARNLDVYLNKVHIGSLYQDDHGNLGFQYIESWLQSPQAVPISQSLPLRAEQFDRNASQPYFGGILPEANQRDTIAKNLGISHKNDFAMLEQIGGECAGAVTFMPTGELLPAEEHQYRFLNAATLADTLRRLPNRPLLAGEEGIRLSLAGAQIKLAIYIASNGEYAIPLGGAPSTHIMKPTIKGYDGIVQNEAFCMRLAQAVRIKAANVEIGSTNGIDYLLVERYDRYFGTDQVRRLHQEDFCQALGSASDHKYQNEGGPSLKECFDLIRNVTTRPVIELPALLDAVLFNFLIGNNDAHGKNFSLLYHRGVSLAPLYDLICTVAYPELSDKMAMKIGSEYEYTKVFPRHFDTMAEGAGLSKPMVRKRLTDLAKLILDRIDSVQPFVPQIATIIKTRCEKTIGRSKLVPES